MNIPESERIPVSLIATPRGNNILYGIKNGELYQIDEDEATPKAISVSTTITSSTTGITTAVWLDHEGDEEYVTDAALAFNGSGLPSAGNLRFDIVQGLNDGTVSVKEGTESTSGSVVIPSADEDAVLLSVILWDENGDGQIIPPEETNAWSIRRFATKTAADTTGKYAKVWEGDLSASNNYGVELSYQEPAMASTPFSGSGMRNLKLSFTCDASRNIVTDTVQIVTDGGVSGEFTLYQITGNKAALYHKSNQYWGRIEFRVLFQNSSVLLDDFVNDGVYGAAPGTPVGTWASEVASGGSSIPTGGTTGQVLTKNSATDGDASWQDPTEGSGGGLELIPFSTVINMDGNYKSVHTQTAAIAITKGTFADPLTNFENKTVQLIEASGSHGKPTFTSDFVVQMDTWSNNTGDINQLIFKGSPSGKILVWMDNVELA